MILYDEHPDKAVCTICGAWIEYEYCGSHDAFHDRIDQIEQRLDRLVAALLTEDGQVMQGVLTVKTNPAAWVPVDAHHITATDWQAAHEIVQHESSALAAWLHGLE